VSDNDKTVDIGGMDFVIVHSYGVDQAIADGLLVPLGQEHWPVLTNGLPIVATASLVEQFGEETLKSAYDRFVKWFHHTRPTLPEEEQMYSEELEGVTIWILIDGSAVTLLKPTEY
jgi:hypothetical protein